MQFFNQKYNELQYIPILILILSPNHRNYHVLVVFFDVDGVVLDFDRGFTKTMKRIFLN
jgi:hypothetical protein